MTTAIGLFVAVPAVWMFNYFTGRIDAFDVEMGNSSSELIDYFLKRSQRARGHPQVVQLTVRVDYSDECELTVGARPVSRPVPTVNCSGDFVMEQKKAPPPVSDINVTPMVDVMLVVLIIFMVITPMLSNDQIADRYGAGAEPDHHGGCG